jgi:hypothetical protein
MIDLPKKMVCPLGGKCQEIKDNVIHECAWFMKIAGTNPNTGEDTDEYGCAMAWMPVLLIENSRQQRNTGAAVESFRNEMVKANDSSHQLLLATAKLSAYPLISEKQILIAQDQEPTP